MPRRPYSQIDMLTPAEKEVLEGYVNGLSPKEIAKQRGVSKGTVKQQLQNARNRAGEKSLLHLVIAYFKMRLSNGNQLGSARWEERADPGNNSQNDVRPPSDSPS